MNTINIKPIAVALNTNANAVSFQVLTLTLPPQTFLLNARFFQINQDSTKEVINIPFELPLSDYENWQSDAELEDKCLVALNLERNVQ